MCGANLGNLAKVKVVTYGYDMKIQWVTYKLDPAYAVLGTGYTQPEDVKVSTNGTHAYVTERSGALLRVALNNANGAAATVVSSGMAAPRRIVLDEAQRGLLADFIGAPKGAVWRVNLSNGSRTAVVTNLNSPVGLALSADLQFAYVTEQGAGGGQVTRIQLSNGARTVLASGIASPSTSPGPTRPGHRSSSPTTTRPTASWPSTWPPWP